jgi:hypothetical protein
LNVKRIIHFPCARVLDLGQASLCVAKASSGEDFGLGN